MSLGCASDAGKGAGKFGEKTSSCESDFTKRIENERCMLWVGSNVHRRTFRLSEASMPRFPLFGEYSLSEIHFLR